MKAIALVGIFAAVLLSVEAAPPNFSLRKVAEPALERQPVPVADRKSLEQQKGPFFDHVRRTALGHLSTYAEKADYDYYCTYVYYYLFDEDSVFIECADILREIIDSDVPSQDSILAYCSLDCGKLLLSALTWLDYACGVDAPNATVTRFLDQSCAVGPDNQYCLEVWAGYVDVKDLPDEGYNCIDDAPTARTCPASCKAFLPWEQKHYGCCLTALLEAYPNHPENDAFDDALHLCNYKYPSLC